ncbi:MAG: DUF1987 domain-containing protein [Leptospiraceae bacterium]|nr:DUF1987 domain-containing protein [Leptospiraceae bacterium]MCP5513184.1 DUF1987 domain-containing protein [Leptospiraceae bacterium]
MDKILIQKTKSSPEIIMDFDKGLLEISGESYPENALSFYKPVFEWLDKAISSKIELTVNFKLNYFNTSSSKCVIDILDSIENYFQNSGKVSVNWYYEEDDDDMMETGEEFSSDLKVPFKMISY